MCSHLTSNILKLDLRVGGWREEELDNGLNDNNIRGLVERCTKLKVLDIRCNEKVTYQGLVAITDKLTFLEVLGLPYSVSDELGLPNNINLSKIGGLRSMKKLEELLIGNDPDEYRSILKRQIPHLRNIDDDTEVAVTDTEGFRSIKFCPNCHECDEYVMYQHMCLSK